jgi:toxin-antitoxin system PIN domain toxin
VIVLDVNLLIYAYNKNSQEHAKARHWIEQLFSSSESVGLPWQTISAFLRITTHPNLKDLRITVEQSSKIVDRWLEQPNVRILIPGEGHWALFRRMLLEGQASGGLVTDAHLAALTMEYGGVLHTMDRDFSRFPGLRWINPLSN